MGVCMKPQRLGIMPLAILVWTVAVPTSRTPAAAQVSPSTDVAAVQQGSSPGASGDLRIDAQAFERFLRGGNVVVVDVRDEAAYRRAHIPNAVSVPLERLEREVARLRESGASVVTYCGGPKGDKGAAAAALLRRLGVKHVYALDGGLQRWVDEGHVVEVQPTGAV